MLLFKGICEACGARFEFVSDSVDGFRLLRSKNNLLPAKVLYFEDIVFDEVYSLVKQRYQNSGLTELEIAKRFDCVFGKICDLAPDGSVYDMSGKVYCPKCHSDNTDYGPTSPPKYVDEEEIPNVTHRQWDALDPEQKKLTVENLLKEIEKDT